MPDNLRWANAWELVDRTDAATKKDAEAADKARRG
jgi:hypothetical protein